MLFGQEHIDRYIATGGAEGHDGQRIQCLLSTTTGTKSGKARTLSLIYGTHGDEHPIVTSKGGAPEHPAWYVNLRHELQVELQVKDEVVDAVARDTTDAERGELWSIMAREWPAYDEYQTKTDRKIPVVVPTRA